MSRVLIVHATGAPRRAPASLRAEWIAAPLDGLARAGLPSDVVDGGASVDLLDLDDASCPPAGAVPSPGEARLVARWAAHVGVDATGLDAQLAALPWSRFFTGLTAPELVRTAAAASAQVDGGPGLDRAVDAIRRALRPATRVVVGFSLASVPALHAVTGTRRALLTVGSPACALDREGTAALGPSASWFNLHDPCDGLAGPRGLAAVFGPAVQDTLVTCFPRLRAARPYAGTAAFGRLLTAAAHDRPDEPVPEEEETP